MSETAALPRWDMTPIYPSLESPEFAAAFDRFVSGVANLGELFARHDVRRRASGGVDDAFVAAYEKVTGRVNALFEEIETLATYIMCHTSTDAANQLAQAQESRLHAQLVPLDQLFTRYIAWVGSSDSDALIARSQVARDNEYGLRRAAEQYRRQLSEPEEDLLAELRPAGVTAWARLHGNITAMLTATVNVHGEEKTLPMSSVRGLANDPDRDVRRNAFEAELKAWETVKIPIAAALNGIKGWQRSVRSKRRWEDDVAPTLFDNGINAKTLSAMQEACVESFPDFRRYMAAKARLLGLDKLAWYDIGAPVGTGARKWAWDETEDFIRANFGLYSQRLSDFADRAFRERWIDAEPRVGKEGGGYCAQIRPGESRIMVNFEGSFDSVATLAHELGHGYHNLDLKHRTPLQRETPSTLAETASIFCERLAFDAVLKKADASEKLTLLDTTLEGALQVVVDIHSRFLFERAVFERRAERDLTVDELSELITEAQRATYGDSVDPLHPLMWAVKTHYYGPTFYNYPYTYGLLFGLGLYARYLKEPDAFRAQYDDLLSSTGMADGPTLGQRFGVDVTSVAFWRSSLDVIRGQIDEFVGLVG